MARVNLKNIIGKKNEINTAVLALMDQLKEATWIEDENGKLLLGNPTRPSQSSFPVKLENEVIGWVKGDERSIMIANLLAVTWLTVAKVSTQDASLLYVIATLIHVGSI